MTRRFIGSRGSAVTMAVLVAASPAAAPAFAGAVRAGYGAPSQVSVSSPYLDIVNRYQSGDQLKAVAEMAAYPTSGLRDRARKDLRDLTCQVLCGIADCRRARAEKPEEFERVLEAWAGSMPAAAALHIDTAIQAQAEDRPDVAEAHRQLALELVDLMESELAPAAAGASPIARPRITDGPAFSGPTQTGPDPRVARRGQASQLVSLLSIWLLQLRGDLAKIDAPLAKVQQRFPQDPMVALALGSLHEAHATPNALVENSAGRQGNLEKWRQEERAFRLEQAIAAYRQAITLDPTLAEAHLRLGHVLLLTGRTDEADASLARASTETGDKRWRYLAEMLRADAADARGDASGARERYESALAAWPDAQSPVLALSRLDASAGQWPAAQARLAALAPRTGGRAEDPWWAYGFGQAWRIDAGLATLRRLVVR
jgi:tetratricopeptide (TPR) repeat protein